MLLSVILLIVGLVMLYYGAEGLVDGASALALGLGITPLVVGLTVVSFGTSAPELLVSLAAIWTNSSDISVGNIIGSNIANIALVMGVSAMVNPLEVQTRAVRRELPIMIGASVLFVLLAVDGQLSRLDGGLLLAGMAGYIAYTFVEARRDMRMLSELVGDDLLEGESDKVPAWKNVVKLVLGMAGLALGAKLMVDSAVEIALFFEIPELVIGISIIAIGTSLPELATSVIAAYRNESDISVGNIIGSNIFNLLFVMGAVSAIAALAVGGFALSMDIWVMIAVALAAWPILRSGMVIRRMEGALLVVAYIAYMIVLFIR